MFGDDSTDMSRNGSIGHQRPSGIRPARPNRPFNPGMRRHGMPATGGVPQPQDAPQQIKSSPNEGVPPAQPYVPPAPPPAPVDSTGTYVQKNYNPNDSYNNMRFNGAVMTGGGNVNGTVNNPMGIINSSPKEGIPATGGIPLGDPNAPPPMIGNNPIPFDAPPPSPQIGPSGVVNSSPVFNGGGWEDPNYNPKMRQF